MTYFRTPMKYLEMYNTIVIVKLNFEGPTIDFPLDCGSLTPVIRHIWGQNTPIFSAPAAGQKRLFLVYTVMFSRFQRAMGSAH